MSTPTSGRRAAEAPSRPMAPALVLAVALPLLTVGTLALVPTGGPQVTTEPPELTALTRTSLGCPAARGESRSVLVGSSLAEEDGRVTVDRLGGDAGPRRLDVRPFRLTSADPQRAAVVTGEDEWAPGLLAARTGTRTAVACEAPAREAWFTGVGARPQHASVVELVNPDPGPAIADLTVLAPGGPLDVPDVRGVRVPGRSSVELDLARIVPRRTELAVRVVVSRGRLTSSVWDTVDELGAGPSASDWVAPQAEPSTSGIVLGLPTGAGSRRLTLANGGPDETRVDVRIVAPESVFDPAGLEEISIPPGSVRSVRLDELLAREIRAGSTGLLIEASNPVSASVRTFADADLAHAVAAAPIDERAATVVPPGRGRLVLAGATRPGVATVLSRTTRGRTLREERVEIGPDRSVTVRLPDDTAYVALEVRRTAAVASVVVQGPGGVIVLPLRETVRSGLVPAVRPDLP